MIITPLNNTESSVHLSGYVTGTTGTKDIWPISAATAVIPIPEILRSVSVSSSDATDVSTNNGAHIVRISGLDEYYNMTHERISLNGQTPVPSVYSYTAINGLEIVDTGSDGANKGVVYVGIGAVSSGVPATPYCAIAATAGTSQSICFTVPANHTFEVESISLMPKTVGTTSFEWRIRKQFLVDTQVVYQVIANLVYRDPAQSYTEFKYPMVFNEKETFTMQVVGLNSGGDIVVEVTGKLKSQV